MSFSMLTLIGATVLMALIGSSLSYSDTYSNTPSYSYAYQILDTYSGQDFGHEEASKSGKVNGEYRVLLPDDRLQVVSYSADQNGYVADVQYADGSSSPAYGKAAGGYSSGGASVKTSSYFNPPTTSGNSGYSVNNGGYQYGGASSTGNSYGAGSYNNNYQSGAGVMAGQGSMYQQTAFKSGCVCQCPA
ncbi:pro-resilin-like isoform X1 [Daphnia pulex]|uniref:Cuticular protein n=1 Tax=Daphnia pulex TaxID=6669 RepID=E9FY50_DAPPU|nr:pro-resilin-like isoform X1 [Daphnia pulex]EFX87476.1 hypothetical protein DAPPUDRAFT_306354 [Daphnia pulex]|eukprot:EFX87476.1 hypothetical protein DAPPUDRAFT_306354 [Daphnia pulex]